MTRPDQPLSISLHSEVPTLSQREAKLLRTMAPYTGFPFTKHEKFASLEKILLHFKQTTLNNTWNVIEGKVTLADLERPVIYVTGLPGVGKSEMVRQVIKPFAEVVAGYCQKNGLAMEVWAPVWEEYEHKANVPATRPLTNKELSLVGKLMDEDIAERLRKKPNMIVIVDKPGGTQYELTSLLPWNARSYGAIAKNMIYQEKPFAGIPIALTSIGVIGGPYMRPWVEQRDAMIQAKDDIRSANMVRRTYRLPQLQTLEELHTAQIGGTKEIVEKVHSIQWAMVYTALHTKTIEGKLRQYIPRYIADLAATPVPPNKFDNLPLSTKLFLTKHSLGKKLRRQILETIPRSSPREEDFLFTLVACSLLRDFAGAELLKYSLGFDMKSPGWNKTIVYNNPKMPLEGEEK